MFILQQPRKPTEQTGLGGGASEARATIASAQGDPADPGPCLSDDGAERLKDGFSCHLTEVRDGLPWGVRCMTQSGN